MSEAVDRFENRNEEIGNKIEVMTEVHVKQNKMSYSDIVRERTVIPNVGKRAPLIIKPKKRQNVATTKEKLNGIDPVDLKKHFSFC